MVLSALLAAGAFLALAAGFLAFYAESRLSRLVLGGLGESFSTRVYSAPFLLNEQAHPSPERLIARLERLRYRRVEGSTVAAGEYAWAPPELLVHLRGFQTPQYAQEAGLYVLLAQPDDAWELRTFAGEKRAQLELEPEVLAELSGKQRERREPATWEELPELLKRAVVAAEDKRFFSHWGLDPRALARAAWRDLRHRGGVQGGSTITQQLAKNYFLSPQRTLQRKLTEAGLAFYLELRFGKKEILTLYLNHIYLGQEGPVSVMGMKAAARFYFDKDLRDLSLAECATLAGLVRSPYRYNPRRDPGRSTLRRNYVLARMRDLDMIGEPELRAALLEPVTAKPLPPSREANENAFVTAEVLRRLEPRYGEEALFRYGLSIHTTVDPLMQSEAQGALRKGRAQAALVALDPATGRILAMAGGRDFRESQFNRATMAARQPGSAFKPFVYAAALEAGLTPATLLQDTTREFVGEDGAWAPRNYEGVYHGTTTVRQALAHSMNGATLDLAARIGTKRILELARRLGIESPLDNSYAVALGASEVSLLELTAAYAPFANGGFRVTPYLVSTVQDAQGNTLEFTGFQRSPVLEPALAYLMTSLLRSVVQEGTAKGLARMGWDRPSAGKTGTTNDGRDAWFIGYAPELLTGVWFGDDAHKPLRATGAKDALPMWAAFMKQALRDYPATPFLEPAGLVTAVIDPASGLLARSGCPQKSRETFVSGTEPKQDCPLHPGGLKGWWKRLFGK